MTSTGTKIQSYERQARHVAITSLGVGVVAALGLVLAALVSFTSWDPAEWARIVISLVGTVGILVGAGLAAFAWSQGRPHGEARRWAGAELLLATVCAAAFVVMLGFAY